MSDQARVYCEDCGWIVIALADIKVILARPVSPPDIYVFRCPKCGHRVEVAAGMDSIATLIALNVETDRTPKEMFEHGDGPPLTSDDLLTFHELLAATDPVELCSGLAG